MNIKKTTKINSKTELAGNKYIRVKVYKNITLEIVFNLIINKTRMIMKRKLNYFVAAGILFASLFNVSCSGDDKEGNLFPAAPTNVTATVDADVASTIKLEWNEVETDDYGATILAYNVFRSTSADGDFEKIKSEIKTSKTDDKGLSFSTTYYYKVQVVTVYPDKKEGNTSGVVNVTTGEASLNPVVNAVAISDGEGATAILKYVRVDFEVAEVTSLSSFKVFRDGKQIGTVTATTEDFYSYNDINVSYGIEYTYTVTAVGNDGTEYAGNEDKITPERPAAIERPVPEILKISSSRNPQKIDVTFKDVKGSKYEIIGEVEGITDPTTWTMSSSELGTDSDGNRTFTINCSELTLPTDRTIWANIKIKAYISNGWSDYATKRMFVF